MIPKPTLDLSIVIPIHNEAESLPPLHAELDAVLKALGQSYEIITVDDGSSDNSLQVLKQLAHSDLHLVIVSLRRNFGQTAAFAAGFDQARGAVVITIDADGQNDPADIPTLLAKMDEGYDIVSGWRQNRKEPLLTRKIPSRVANAIITGNTGISLHDSGCSLKTYRYEVVKTVKLYGDMHRFIPAFASWMGVKVAEVPVKDRARKFGKSHVGFSRTFRVFLDLFTLSFLLSFQSKPMRLFGGMGAATGAIGVLILAYLAFIKIFEGALLSNRPILWLGVMLVILGVQFLFFGLLAEMQMRTYYESQGKSIYVVREIISHTTSSTPDTTPTSAGK
ncbi:MAG TPA: glycosyltransferase family 2 protein [Anaerolineae bacterium]|nr:glycosyltransferase family 2 protein [Anaerolineae bacterium]